MGQALILHSLQEAIREITWERAKHRMKWEVAVVTLYNTVWDSEKHKT